MLKTKPLNALLAQSLSNHVSEALLFTPSGNLVATASATNTSNHNAREARTHAALAANIWANYESASSHDAINQSLPYPPPSSSSPTSNSRMTTTPSANAASSTSSSTAPEKPSSKSQLANNNNNNNNSNAASTQPVKSITIETSDNNLHIQAVTPAILLALVGPKQPTRHTSSNSSQHSNETLELVENSVPKGAGSKTGSILSNIGGGGGGGAAGGASLGSGSASSAAPIAGGTLGVLKLTAQALADFLEKELKDFEPPDSV